MDTKARRRIATTEFAVGRAIGLGLTRDDDLLSKAVDYLEGLLTGEIRWPEGKEANDRWPVGQEMFVSATLAQIEPSNKLLGPVYDKWTRIAENTFESGRYDAEKERQAHCELTGATTMRNSYLVLNNRYSLILLGNVQDCLDDDVEHALVDWIWNHPRGMGYLDAPLHAPFSEIGHNTVERWFASQEILSRFRSWRAKACKTMQEIRTSQNADGLWDFGPKARSRNLRLSETWRKQKDRVIDHSVRVLALLRTYHTGNENKQSFSREPT